MPTHSRSSSVSSESEAKKQRPQLYYNAEDPHDVFSRCTVHSPRVKIGEWFVDENAVQDPVACWNVLHKNKLWGNEDFLIMNLHRIYFLVYYLVNEPANDEYSFGFHEVPNRGDDDPIWRLLPNPEHAKNLVIGVDRQALLLGWAIVEKDRTENTRPLRMFDTMIRGHNFGELFYELLSEKLPGLVICDPDQHNAHPSHVYWKKIGALADTKRIWGTRSPARIGWGVADLLCASRNITGHEFNQLLRALEKNAARPLCQLAVYLRIALDCDTPILEAVAHTYPQPSKLAWLYRSEGGIEYVYPWQLPKPDADPNALPRGANTSMWRFNENKQMRFKRGFYQVRTLTEVLFAAGDAQTISFRPNNNQQDALWRDDRTTWPAIFAEHGMRLTGSSFGAWLGD